MQPSLVKRLALAAGLTLVAGAAQAGLVSYQSNGVDLVYDDVQDLTWMRDANLFKTQYGADNTVVDKIMTAVPSIADSYYGTHTVVAWDFDAASGRMTWWGAMAWAQWLGSVDYAGADDWRLPMTVQPDATCSDQFDLGTGDPIQGWGFDCTGSDIGSLFYTNGGLNAGDYINDSAILTGAFTNMQDYVYWSGTQFAPDPNYAWNFYTDNSYQLIDLKDFQSYGWAVRPGQVAAAPLPSTAVLLALGLIGLGARKLGRRATLVIR